MKLTLWLSGLLKIPAAFGIVTVCYFHFWFWNTASYIELDPVANTYDFIVGNFIFNQLFSSVKCCVMLCAFQLEQDRLEQ